MDHSNLLWIWCNNISFSRTCLWGNPTPIFYMYKCHCHYFMVIRITQVDNIQANEQRQCCKKNLQTLGTCSVFFKSYGSLLKNSRTSQLLAMYFGFYTLTGNSSLGVYSPEWVQNILYPKYTKKWFSKILYITYELRILCLMGTHHMCF